MPYYTEREKGCILMLSPIYWICVLIYWIIGRIEERKEKEQ